MLDQNTDRMWYVIGALVVGGGIILIANKSVPGAFANVSDRFEQVSDEGVKVVSLFTPEVDENGDTNAIFFKWDTVQAGGQDAVAITGYRYFGPTEISIPDKIDGKPVVSISNGAFSETQITKIQMPSTITSIDNNAFKASPIESVTFSNNITEIGDNAFQYTNLKEITLPNKLTTIGRQAFNNSPLEKVQFNEGLKTIKEEAFMYTNIERITLPSTIESIAKGSFNSSPLNHITVPKSVIIPDGTFASYVTFVKI